MVRAFPPLKRLFQPFHPGGSFHRHGPVCVAGRSSALLEGASSHKRPANAAFVIELPPLATREAPVPEQTRILVIDVHVLFRESYRAFCSPVSGFRIVGECADGRGGVGAVKEHSVDIVLLDISLGSQQGGRGF